MRILSTILMLPLLAGCMAGPAPVISNAGVKASLAAPTDHDIGKSVVAAVIDTACAAQRQGAKDFATRSVSDHIWGFLYSCRYKP